MRRRRRNNEDDDQNGFAGWVTIFLHLSCCITHVALYQGGYMEAKKSKLVEQYNTVTLNQVKKKSDIFSDIKIFVNGRTIPPAEELKVLIATHGGEYHTYQSSKTTHIIASNLPNVKVNIAI